MCKIKNPVMLIIFSTLILMRTHTYAQEQIKEPVKEQIKEPVKEKESVKEKEPVKAVGTLKAILTGPDSKELGKLVILSAKGTVADNVKFECIPENTDWQAIRFIGNDDYGIIFSTDKPGTYTFILIATSKAGDVSIAKHPVTIGSINPNPINPPTPINPINPKVVTILNIQQLQDAYSSDLAAGVGTAQQKTLLANLFAESSKTIIGNQSITKPGQVYDAMRQVSLKILPQGSLPQLRKTLADAEKLYLNINSTVPFNDDLRKKMSDLFNQIAVALNQLKEN